jgi:lipopolysaccharide biosynthesis regulator YciM
VDRIDRRELKHDKFVEQVGHSVDYAAHHKGMLIRWGSIAAAAVIVIVGTYFYLDHQQSIREDELRAALQIQQANIGPADASPYVTSFATQAEKDKATEKAMADLAGKYPSKREGIVARIYLGSMYSDQGKLADAEKQWQLAADAGDKDYSSQAKFSLAGAYAAEGKTADAEKLLRELIAQPTIMVSKEQATIALAGILAKNNPAEARKLLEPLRTERAAVSRAAITALSEIPQR